MKKHYQSTFLWNGVNKNNQTISGEIKAPNQQIAKILLHQQSIKILTIQKQTVLSKMRQHFSRITQKDLSFIIQHLATLLAAGIPLLQSIQFLEKNSQKYKLKKLLNQMHQSLREGNSLTQTLQQHKQYFSELICQLINTAEYTGTLDETLQYIATYREKINILKKKLKKALFYPCFVLIIALIVSSILLIFVIPQFAKLFDNANQALPLLTQLVIQLAQFTKNHVSIIFSTPILFGITIFFLQKKYTAIKIFFENRLIRLPFVGNLIRKIITARIARTLATTLSAGIPILDALSLATNATTHHLFKKALQRIKTDVSRGESLHQTMCDQKLFPSLTAQIVAIGEEAGKLDSVLQRVATSYETEVDVLMDNLSQLLEPVIMAVIGIIVGVLMIAMYLPLFKLGTVI